jgi:DNA-binding winged helix-turn-helix (wHTH) protein
VQHLILGVESAQKNKFLLYYKRFNIGDTTSRPTQMNEDFPYILGQNGPLKGSRVEINRAIVIGRDPTCAVVIADRQVSRYHATLTPTPQGIRLEDMGSKNGTHCNGERLEAPVLLQDGDIIQIALAQEFTFLSSDSTMPLTEPMIRPGRLKMDSRSRSVWVKQQQVEPPLSALQFHLLYLLYEKQGQVLSRQELVSAAWGTEQSMGVSDQALDALIRRLRDRLAEYDPRTLYIVTVRGHGLRLDNPPDE